MPEKQEKPVFTVTLYPPMALTGYLVAFSAAFLVYGVATGIADTFYVLVFIGLIILLSYAFYYVLTQPVWRAKFYKKAFSVKGRKKHGDINYGQLGEISSRRALFGLLSMVEITLKNEPTRLRILGNPRNFELQTDLHDWLLQKLK